MTIEGKSRLMLRHIGGERREVEVVGYFRKQLVISWGSLAGVYYLDIPSNSLVRARTWSAENIVEARKVLDLLANHQKIETEKGKPQAPSKGAWKWEKKRSG